MDMNAASNSEALEMSVNSSDLESQEPLTAAQMMPSESISRQAHEQALAQARAKELRLERQLSQYRAIRQDEVLHSAISAWAVDPEVVLHMIQNNFAMDEAGQVYPVDAQGSPLLDKESKAMNMETFFQRFRKEKPYLVKASVTRGAGSLNEANSVTSALSPNIEEMAELPMAQFIKAGGLKGIKK
jgi:hypothetical protein